MDFKIKIKSFLLVFLFITSIFLSNKVFFQEGTKNDYLNQDSEKWLEERINSIEFFNPQSYVINFGGSLHYKEKTGTKKIKKIIIGYFSEKWNKSNFKKIDENIWNNSISNRGIQCNLNYSMDWNNFISLIKNKEFSSDINLNVKGFNFLTSGDILFKTNSGYYKISKAFSSESLEELILESEKDYTEYRTLEEIYSLKKVLEKEDNKVYSNNTLVPIESVKNLPIIEVSNEVNIFENSEDIIKSYADKILGVNFIRKAYDTEGSIIYMTGYGKNILKIDKNGFFEYTTTADSDQKDNELTFYKGLENSINALKTIEDLPREIYLSGYSKKTEDKFEIIEYYFDFSYGNYEMNIDKEHSFYVKFSNGKIQTIKRRYKKFLTFENVDREVLLLREIIDKNYNIFLDYKINDDNLSLFRESKQQIYEIINSIEEFCLAYYYKREDYKEKAIPIWKIKLENRYYYIDCYTGEIIYTYMKGEI